MTAALQSLPATDAVIVAMPALRIVRMQFVAVGEEITATLVAELLNVGKRPEELVNGRVIGAEEEFVRIVADANRNTGVPFWTTRVCGTGVAGLQSVFPG